MTGTGDTLDIGFVPAEVPGTEWTGATRTSTMWIERLSRHHDLTVYVVSQHEADDVALPARERVEYVLLDDLPTLPHPTLRKARTLAGEAEALNGHDLVHAYSSAFVPVLADLDVPTLSTLHSYLPVCPKEDMLYRDGSKCSGPGRAKCTRCVLEATLDRDGGRGGDADGDGSPGERLRSACGSLGERLRSAYGSLGKYGLVEASIDRADGVSAYHAIAPHLREDYAGLGFPRERTAVVPHFYEEEFLNPGDDHDFEPDPVELLYVGRLQGNKGPHVLVEALPTIVERGHDVRLRVAGTGPIGDDLRALADRLGVADRIDWLGYVDHADLPAEYARADVFVYPGLLDEPFGRVLLEALGMRTPVLASAVGSTDYIVGDGGVRFEAGDGTALADELERLLAEYDAHYHAIPDHLDRFEPEGVERELLDLYGRVAAQGRAATTPGPRPPGRR